MTELVEQAKRGDMLAFESLVRQHEKKVYNIALRYTNNEQDALDICQDVFIKIYKSLEGFRAESAFSTWVYSITVNICIDFIRKVKRRSELPLVIDDEDETVIEVPDTSFAPAEIMEKKELRKSMLDAISRLRPDHREVIILREFHDLSYSEISGILDVEEGTIKSRLARARAALRKIIIADGNITPPSASK